MRTVFFSFFFTWVVVFSASVSFGQIGTDELELVAESALAVRIDSEVVTYAKNVDEKRAVASTQKLLAGLIIAEAGGLDEKVPVKKTDGQVEPRNLWITQGSSYRRRTLLEMMLIRSFNDVTKCLARDHSGSQGEFVKAMNARAAELGMKHTVFKNVHGLTAEGQHSTARDMIRLAVAAWRNEELRRIVAIKDTTFTYTGGNSIPIPNSNELLKRYPACKGMKTGYTQAAGRCLVASAEENGRVVVAVILGSTEEALWNDSEKLLRYSLNQ